MAQITAGYLHATRWKLRLVLWPTVLGQLGATVLCLGAMDAWLPSEVVATWGVVPVLIQVVLGACVLEVLNIEGVLMGNRITSIMRQLHQAAPNWSQADPAGPLIAYLTRLAGEIAASGLLGKNLDRENPTQDLDVTTIRQAFVDCLANIERLNNDFKVGRRDAQAIKDASATWGWMSQELNNLLKQYPDLGARMFNAKRYVHKRWTVAIWLSFFLCLLKWLAAIGGTLTI